VIRNVCIHVSNEQPLLADLFTLPAAADAGLVCTNVRSLDGKRPIFIDDTRATFFFPYHVIRFLEIPAGAVKAHRPRSQAGTAAPDQGDGTAALDGSQYDDPDRQLAIAVGPPSGSDADEEVELDIEIDEGFLQRIRDI
jgi:hypothetical protein